MRWALAKGRPVRFIDLPAATRLALRRESASEEPGRGRGTTETAPVVRRRRENERRSLPPTRQAVLRDKSSRSSLPSAAIPLPISPRSPATKIARPGGTP